MKYLNFKNKYFLIAIYFILSSTNLNASPRPCDLLFSKIRESSGRENLFTPHLQNVKSLGQSARKLDPFDFKKKTELRNSLIKEINLSLDTVLDFKGAKSVVNTVMDTIIIINENLNFDKHLDEFDLHFSSAFIRIRENLTKEQKIILIEKVSSLKGKNWSSSIYGINLALFPTMKSINLILDDLPDDTFIQFDSHWFRNNLKKPLLSLPKSIQLKASRETLIRLFHITRGDIIKTQVGRFIKKGPLFVKRNLEVILSYLSKNNTDTLGQNLMDIKRPHSKEKLIEVVDNYYDEMNILDKVKSKSDRGGYSFKKVIKLANILRSSFSTTLNDDKFYIEFYGSAPNGKMNLKLSDIDIQFSSDLHRYFIDQINPIFLEKQSWKTLDLPSWKHRMTEFTIKIRNSYDKASENLDKYLSRTSHDKTIGFLSNVAPLPLNVLSSYNPISVKIFKSKLVFIFHNTFSNETIEIQIP